MLGQDVLICAKSSNYVVWANLRTFRQPSEGLDDAAGGVWLLFVRQANDWGLDAGTPGSHVSSAKDGIGHAGTSLGKRRQLHWC